MSTTRTKLNLKHTSIHDHLLNREINTYSTMNVLLENQNSDIKYSPSTSAIGSSQPTDKLTTEDECQLLMKSSGDCNNSILPIDNYHEKLLSPRKRFDDESIITNSIIFR